MARPLRIKYAGAFYHITSRGNERRPIFFDDRDREKLLSFFSKAVVRYGLAIHTYCLMGNHYHLLLETAKPNLSQAMHFINGGYTNYYNRAHHRSGHLFQGRYRAILVEKDPYASTLSRYIHLNPVRAGHSRRPEEYPWSSYGGYLNPKKKASWLETSLILGYFSSKDREARRRYKRFVEEGMMAKVSDPLGEVISGALLGAETFVEWVRGNVIRGMREGRDLPAINQLKPRPSIEQVSERVESSLGRDHRWFRDVSLSLCHRYTGETLREIGAFHGGMGESAVSQAVRRMSRRMEGERRLKEEISKIEMDLKKLSIV